MCTKKKKTIQLNTPMPVQNTVTRRHIELIYKMNPVLDLQYYTVNCSPMNMRVATLIFAVVLLYGCVHSKTVFDNGIEPLQPSLGFNNIPVFANMLRRRCPVCDSSVYSYCSDKLFHDSCCCNRPSGPYDRLPFQCQFADCSFLHANSCQEHRLITACCCTNYLYKK